MQDTSIQSVQEKYNFFEKHDEVILIGNFNYKMTKYLDKIPEKLTQLYNEYKYKVT